MSDNSRNSENYAPPLNCQKILSSARKIFCPLLNFSRKISLSELEGGKKYHGRFSQKLEGFNSRASIYLQVRLPENRSMFVNFLTEHRSIGSIIVNYLTDYRAPAVFADISDFSIVNGINTQCRHQSRGNQRIKAHGIKKTRLTQPCLQSFFHRMYLLVVRWSMWHSTVLIGFLLHSGSHLRSLCIFRFLLYSVLLQ